jgi:hypothetical protein
MVSPTQPGQEGAGWSPYRDLPLSDLVRAVEHRDPSLGPDKLLAMVAEGLGYSIGRPLPNQSPPYKPHAALPRYNGKTRKNEENVKKRAEIRSGKVKRRWWGRR